MNKVETDLNKIYGTFFNDLKIDVHTGIVNGSDKRFATKIAIGENYHQSKKKILFVSLDIGKDENYVEKNENTFQDFQQRKESITQQFPSNPHMAGVYGTTLYFLKYYYDNESAWNLLESQSNFFKEALNNNQEKMPKELLSNIALINFYNFVTKGRKARSNGNDRFFIDETKELQFLIDIINSVSPDVVIIQSKSLKNYFKNKIKPNISDKIDLYCGYHPSVFGRGIKYRNPKKYIENLLESKL